MPFSKVADAYHLPHPFHRTLFDCNIPFQEWRKKTVLPAAMYTMLMRKGGIATGVTQAKY